MRTTSSFLTCQLPEADRDERIRAWRSLAPLIIRRDSTEAGFRLVLDDSALGQLETLVAAERSCCGWATWSVISDPPHAVVEVSGPAEPLAALAAAFGL